MGSARHRCATGAGSLWRLALAGFLAGLWCASAPARTAAEPREEEGVAAFNALIGWRGGAYTLQSGRSTPAQTIRGAFSYLLMEALRLADEKLAKSTGEAAGRSSPIR